MPSSNPEGNYGCRIRNEEPDMQQLRLQKKFIKNTMKKETIEFACDAHPCRKKIKVVANLFHQVKYPYDKGWKYIFKFAYKIDNKQRELCDKHFCSKKCMVNYLDKAIQ